MLQDIEHGRIMSSSAPIRYGTNHEDQGGDDLGVATVAAKPKLEKPPMYKVIMLNDDYTPMEFVVYILQKFFSMDAEKAMQIMLAVHTSGSAVCGVYPKDAAETKVNLVNAYAQDNHHPLLSKAEITG